jgi:hypothetical protein
MFHGTRAQGTEERYWVQGTEQLVQSNLEEMLEM